MSSLILPAAALAALTFLTQILTAVFSGLRDRRANGDAETRDIPAKDYPFAPDWLEGRFRNYNYLREHPLLFYAAVALQTAAGFTDPVQLRLAWAYVAIRVVHALVYTVANPLTIRLALFAASGVVLAVFWARLVVSVL